MRESNEKRGRKETEARRAGGGGMTRERGR